MKNTNFWSTFLSQMTVIIKLSAYFLRNNEGSGTISELENRISSLNDENAQDLERMESIQQEWNVLKLRTEYKDNIT